MSKELEVKKSAPLAAFVDAGDFGGGLEGADRDSFAIPFLRVIQKSSPQVDEAKPEFNPNAKPGMFVNSVTGELYDGKNGITLLQCAYQRRFTRWTADGGFKGEMLPDDVAAGQAAGRIRDIDGQLTIEGDELSDNRYHYVLLVTDSGASQLLLSLSSTQIKKSKQLMSMLSSLKVKAGAGLVTPPTWLSKVKATTVLESNDKGSWYGVKFELDGQIEDKELYDLGKAFHNDVSEGAVKAATPPADEAAPNKF